MIITKGGFGEIVRSQTGVPRDAAWLSWEREKGGNENERMVGTRFYFILVTNPPPAGA